MDFPREPHVRRWPWPTNKSAESKVVLAVVLVVLVVTIAALAVGVTLLRITVTLWAPTPCGTACWDIVVTSVSASEPLNSYMVGLAIEGTGSPQSAPLAPGFIWGPQGVSLTFMDVGSPSHLDAGDAFRLENPGNPGICRLSLTSLRADASVNWTC